MIAAAAAVVCVCDEDESYDYHTITCQRFILPKKVSLKEFKKIFDF